MVMLSNSIIYAIQDHIDVACDILVIRHKQSFFRVIYLEEVPIILLPVINSKYYKCFLILFMAVTRLS